jgi:hypothetical protein
MSSFFRCRVEATIEHLIEVLREMDQRRRPVAKPKSENAAVDELISLAVLAEFAKKERGKRH